MYYFIIIFKPRFLKKLTNSGNMYSGLGHGLMSPEIKRNNQLYDKPLELLLFAKQFCHMELQINDSFMYKFEPTSCGFKSKLESDTNAGHFKQSIELTSKHKDSKL